MQRFDELRHAFARADAPEEEEDRALRIGPRSARRNRRRGVRQDDDADAAVGRPAFSGIVGSERDILAATCRGDTGRIHIVVALEHAGDGDRA